MSRTATGHTARTAMPLPYDHSPSGRQVRRTLSNGATGSVDCFTSIRRSHDVCGQRIFPFKQLYAANLGARVLIRVGE